MIKINQYCITIQYEISTILINKFIPISRSQREDTFSRQREPHIRAPNRRSLMRVFRTCHDDVRPFNDPVNSLLRGGFCPLQGL